MHECWEPDTLTIILASLRCLRNGCRFTFLLFCAVPVALAAGITRLLA